ncbi:MULTISPECIES: anti-sigma factor domain-containing protein [unclassified Caballeronia]|uniref:anti-sigma factor n=1 Tax=unclassified Caballeronia TaxID=2646786 RepID=UPI00286472F5|nr:MULTISPECIES: anti-sigma factor [unclassified Caballeronia]MDR5749840.1 anti-sigma factor [Caballeronia sp. LZ024]MDR5843032.1 anti-sigma factor [Caballeronia sp. LZ031]
MDLNRHPDLVDRLAAEYALGVMRGPSRRRFEAISQQDPAIRVAIETWRARVQALGELAPHEKPSAAVWDAIERRLNLGGARRPAAAALPQRAPPRWFESLSFWRGWSIAATAVAAIALVVALRQLTPVPAPVPAPQVAEEPHVGYVVALADKESRTTMLVTWDDRSSEMTVRRMSGVTDPAGKSMQLWGLPKEGHPVSLGVLPPGGTARFKAASVNTFPALAVSVEPPGGSPNPNAPTGPVIYTGKVVPAA